MEVTALTMLPHVEQKRVDMRLLKMELKVRTPELHIVVVRQRSFLKLTVGIHLAVTAKVAVAMTTATVTSSIQRSACS